METTNACKLPCVVQIGFAGSRDLFPGVADPKALYGEVERFLLDRFARLRDELGLGHHHFFCGISQVAIGADFAFSRACRALEIPQRIFLAQSRDAYLNAISPNGAPDFGEAQIAEALALLESPHIIQERVVSESPDRRERFRDAIMETLRVSDLVVCVMPADTQSPSGRGGTNDLLEVAELRGKPALEIRVGTKDGQATFTETWHGLEKFHRPEPPADFAAVECSTSPLPDSAAFLGTLKEFAGEHAKKRKRLFSFLILAIVGLHVFATVLATGALALHGEGVNKQIHGHEIARAFLVAELVCLFAGMMIHRQFHHSAPARVWAESRLVAEIIRSVVQLRAYPLYLGHLFALPFPHQIRPLLRTINVLHLRSTRGQTPTDWKTVRDHYVVHRLNDQLEFYRRDIERLTHRVAQAKTAFWFFAILAFLFTSVKLALSIFVPEDDHSLDLWLPAFGLFAVVFPVLAVAVMSWSIAMSYEGRLHTYAETHRFLNGAHRVNLETAQTKAEFEHLLVETELRLLGETLNWYYRQSFAEVG